MLEQVDRGIDALGRVVRRMRRRHADGNAGRAIGQQVREAGGRTRGSCASSIIGVAEVDGVLVETFEQRLGACVRRLSV